MTGGTIQAGRNMRRHGIHHAFRRITIVAGYAIVNDARMIEGCRYEGTGSMADTAVLVSVDMVDFLGCRETSIVTGCAVIHYARVTKGRRLKTGGLVAVDTIVVGRHMEVVFSGGRNAVMAGRTVIDDTLVFKSGIGKGCRRMAHRAILVVDRNMVGLGSGPGCNDPVVARRTVIHDTGMIEHRWCKGSARHVTDTAVLGGYDVDGIDLRILADCRHPIMAGVAAHGQHSGIGMVDIRIGKISLVMAKSAIGRGCRVWRSGRLASGPECNEIAVMTGGTIPADARVSENRGRGVEPGNRMANVTILTSR